MVWFLPEWTPVSNIVLKINLLAAQLESNRASAPSWGGGMELLMLSRKIFKAMLPTATAKVFKSIPDTQGTPIIMTTIILIVSIIMIFCS
jgi:hypothetical protein